MDHQLLANILLAAPVLLFSLVAHEWAHAYAALTQGDSTAYSLGRLTFDPRKHIDPVWTILLPAVLLVTSGGAMALGGAKPCPVDPRNYRHDRRSDLIVSLAGVAMNLVLAVLAAAGILLLGVIGRDVVVAAPTLLVLQEMLSKAVELNLLLVSFNLLPIPPLDGSHVVKYLLPARLVLPYLRLARYGTLILVVLLAFGAPLLEQWLAPGSWIAAQLLHPVRPFLLAGLP